MGLKSDFDEVRLAWPTYPWRLKVWLLLSAFLASGSIASLSETIFRWKGFILDAIIFYREYVSTPVKTLLSALLGLQVTRGQADIVILFVILISALLRVFLHSKGPWNSPPRSTSLYFLVGTVAWVATSLQWGDTTRSIAGPFGSFLALTCICSVYYGRRGGATRILWFAYMLTPFVFVGIAAAVNSGLTKT